MRGPGSSSRSRSRVDTARGRFTRDVLEPRARATQYSRDRFGRLVAGGIVWAFVLGNVVAIVWLWIANHNLDFSFAPDYWATLMARLGGLTGLLAAFTALVQVLLLARLPFLGRLIGFDRLTVWHRWNGYLCLLLVLAHTVMAVLGFSLDGRRRSSASSGSSWPTTS